MYIGVSAYQLSKKDLQVSQTGNWDCELEQNVDC